MTTVLAHKRKLLRMAPRKYLVSGQNCPHAYADTLDEAKAIGKSLADRAMWRGGWNIPILTISVLTNDPLDSNKFRHTGWRMYVPVRGTGMKYKDIVARIKKRHNVSSMVWTKN